MNQTSTQATLDRLFIGVYPCGIVYADRSREEGGDYKQLGFMDYATLSLDVKKDCTGDLLKAVTDHASEIKARQGEEYQISVAGQKVILGSALPKKEEGATIIKHTDVYTGLSELQFQEVLATIKREHLVFKSDDLIRGILAEAQAHNHETGFQVDSVLTLACRLELNKRAELEKQLMGRHCNHVLTEELLEHCWGKSADELAKTLQIWPHGNNRLHYLGVMSYQGRFYGLRLASSVQYARFDWIGFDFIDPICEEFLSLGASIKDLQDHLASNIEAAKRQLGSAPDGLPDDHIGAIVKPFPYNPASAG